RVRRAGRVGGVQDDVATSVGAGLERLARIDRVRAQLALAQREAEHRAGAVHRLGEHVRVGAAGVDVGVDGPPQRVGGRDVEVAPGRADAQAADGDRLRPRISQDVALAPGLPQLTLDVLLEAGDAVA